MQIKNACIRSGLVSLLLGATVPALAQDDASGEAALFPASAARGQTVYSKACVACHGENGDGNGPGAGPLETKPREFTTGIYKYRSTASGELPTDNDLLRTVTEGIPHSQMPSWKYALTAQERLDVVEFIKAFSADFKEATNLDTLDVPYPPPTNPEIVAEGRKVYLTLQCWSCHGAEGQGDGPASSSLVDNWGHSIKPVDFRWSRYKRGNDPQSIYKTVNTGLNGTPMPSWSREFLYGGDKEIDSTTKASFLAEEIKELQEYLKSQPTEADLESRSAEEKKTIDLHRKWALVHYVRSLIRKENLFNWLFVENMELTR